MKITAEIINVLVNDWLDYPDRIVQEQNISIGNMSDEEIADKADEILSHFEFLDQELDYFDLEKGYAQYILYYKQDGVIYGVLYTESPYCDTDFDEDDIFEAEEVTETVIKYQKK